MTEKVARFVLTDIDDGVRTLSRDEVALVRAKIEAKLVLTEMGDRLFEERQLFAPRPGITTRLLEGVLGIDGATSGTWTEEMFDSFFVKNFSDDFYFWVDPYGEMAHKPLFRAPYTSKRRDRLYIYASELGMRPCGITSADGDFSVYANLDCDFTFVFGSNEIINIFDNFFGGQEKICREFQGFLESTEADFGEGNIYEFMKIYLPAIGGCN